MTHRSASICTVVRDLDATVAFYRDIMGLPLIHAITAKGWGREKEQHADFLHFFFDAGRGATIAFFYYIGTDRTARYEPEDHYFYSATQHNITCLVCIEYLGNSSWAAAIQSTGVPSSSIYCNLASKLSSRIASLYEDHCS